MPIIDTKAKYWAAARAGAFGARPELWSSLKEVWDSGYRDKVVLRTLVGSNGPCIYDLSPYEAVKKEKELVSRGIPMEKIYYNPTTDDSRILIQGEWLNDHFLYSTMKKKMRLALQEAPQTADGLRARLLLQHFMTPSSWADFEACVEQFPDHVIEVSVYERNYGDIPGRNAIVWECRRY